MQQTLFSTAPQPAQPSQYHQNTTLTAIATDHREIARRMQAAIRKHRKTIQASR